MRTWQCATVSCNCGLAAREGDDVVVIDMCRDKIPRVYFPSEKTVEKMPGTRIRRDKNGKRFIVCTRCFFSVDQEGSVTKLQAILQAPLSSAMLSLTNNG